MKVKNMIYLRTLITKKNERILTMAGILGQHTMIKPNVVQNIFQKLGTYFPVSILLYF